ncbi:MAG: divergent polysaccharide deacetylase family protein [Parvularculaceae bacterium]
MSRKRKTKRHAAQRVEVLQPFALLRRRFSTRAQVMATLVFAVLGVAAGALGVLLSGNGASAHAGRDYATSLDLRDAPIAGFAVQTAGQSSGRAKIIERIVSAGAPERLTPALAQPVGAGDVRPKIVLIFDDVGLDKAAFDELLEMPGPVTLSFLPYAKDIQPLADRARARGDDLMLHLPMEPTGGADPGPHALKTNMAAGDLFDELAWSLNSFTGFVGVNNHMGSRFTQNPQAMKRVLAMLDQKNLFFVDSLTTSKSVAAAAAASVGAEIFVRDVFLDSDPEPAAIRRQLALAERIAIETGYAIVICHPRRETLDIVGPWLTTAPLRGFELAKVSQLTDIRRNALMASMGMR